MTTLQEEEQEEEHISNEKSLSASSVSSCLGYGKWREVISIH